jgi:CxxC motif-containing protein
MIIFLFILLLILFVPIPLKTSIYYFDENYYIKIYKFEILSKKKSLKKKGTIKKGNKYKKPVKNTILKDKKLIFKLIKVISKNKFKPTLKIKGNISYSLQNHGLTAITYGIISAILPFVYKTFGIAFKIKKFPLTITPIFKEIFYLKLQIEGIIFISFGKIIYMLFLILTTIINERVKRNE